MKEQPTSELKDFPGPAPTKLLDYAIAKVIDGLISRADHEALTLHEMASILFLEQCLRNDFLPEVPVPEILMIDEVSWLMRDIANGRMAGGKGPNMISISGLDKLNGWSKQLLYQAGIYCLNDLEGYSEGELIKLFNQTLAEELRGLMHENGLGFRPETPG